MTTDVERGFNLIHGSFRVHLADLTAAVRALPAVRGRDLAAVGDAWAFYRDSLHHHHQVEDELFFPATRARVPGFASVEDLMHLQHAELDTAIETADRAVALAVADGGEDPLTAAAAALGALTLVLEDHLAVEEREAVPVIAVALTAREVRRLDRRAMGGLPKDRLPLAVGGLAEAARRLPADLPVPSLPLPMRLALLAGWRRRWEAFAAPVHRLAQAPATR
jgi:hypothetical protein